MLHRSYVLLGLSVLAVASAPAAEYPSRPMRIVVPFTPGSASDMLARMIGPKLSEAWGQQVIVDDRPSAGGAVAGTIVATAPPDGHTLLLSSSAFAVSAALYQNLPLVEKLNAEIRRIIAMPDVQERIARDGSAPKSSTPEAFDKFVRDEIAVRKKVFQAAGVKPD